MPGSARIAQEGNISHILTRGNTRQNVFKGDLDYRKYLEIIKQNEGNYQFKSYHHV